MDEMRDEILSIVEGAIHANHPGLIPARVELQASVLGDLAGMTGGAVLAARTFDTVLLSGGSDNPTRQTAPEPAGATRS